MTNIQWEELCDLHRGETGIIIGNGPSLKDVSDAELKAYPSFGTNKIFMRIGFAPDYYACTNPYVLSQSMNELAAWNKPIKFVREGVENLLPLCLPLHIVQSLEKPAFSFRPDHHIYEGFTITYVCLQLAFYMGFSTILLYGIDHRYIAKGKPNEPVEAEGPDQNHFHPEYFSNGDMWQLPDLEEAEKRYELAKRIYENHNRKIYNLTIGSRLTIFERIDNAECQEFRECKTNRADQISELV